MLLSLLWSVTTPCDVVPTASNGPSHLLLSFPCLNSLTLELNVNTLSPGLNSFFYHTRERIKIVSSRSLARLNFFIINKASLVSMIINKKLGYADFVLWLKRLVRLSKPVWIRFVASYPMLIQKVLVHGIHICILQIQPMYEYIGWCNN